jgi:hypothetical protein
VPQGDAQAVILTALVLLLKLRNSETCPVTISILKVEPSGMLDEDGEMKLMTLGI